MKAVTMLENNVKSQYPLTIGAVMLGLWAAFSPMAANSAPAATEGRCVTLTRSFWNDVFGDRNADAARKYLAPHYIQHAPPPQPAGEDWIALWKGVFATEPYGPGKDFDESQKNFKTIIIKITGDDNFAILQAHDSGDYDHGPNTGKTFDSRYTDIFRCEDGKLVEHWYSPEP